MVGSEPDGTNQIGVAHGAKWIAVKAFSEDGGTDADILEAGEWVLAPKDAEGNPHPEMAPDVVNNSWGGGSGLDEWYRDMVNARRAADIFPEFSAGNTDLFIPGGLVLSQTRQTIRNRLQLARLILTKSSLTFLFKGHLHMMK